ncbi:hypothetical protein GOODEAATRI_003310 [Goodea atripinnis]|uniref:Uncharacterized protein n=1 Tax=Goodea atripinnis TaxID=208336 RepID=A0ABV0MEQ4_9TELE
MGQLTSKQKVSFPPDKHKLTIPFPLVHAVPCGDPLDVQLEEEPCEAQCVEVHGGVWKGMMIGNHLVDGVGQQAGPGSAQAQSGLWWEESRGRQS